MKTFKQFCEEAYQLDESGIPIPWKPVLKAIGLGVVANTLENEIVKRLPKEAQPTAKKYLDAASYGPLMPFRLDGQDEEERVKRAREASKTLAPGERWYGDPRHDARVKQTQQTQQTQGILARGRRTQRNYKGIGTQKP